MCSARRGRSWPVLLWAAAVGSLIVVTPTAATGDDSAPNDRSPDLDVLYVGAHPDDEASLLSTFGQWRGRHGIRTGVATITRGEGGGNAVGPEEGPDLGLLREGEERRAVAKAGITDVYNLDEADLYYTVSAPLTERAWKHDDVLGKLVRVVRETRPEVVVTMDPAPTPGNHGNHQYAARLALEAYQAAADPNAFGEQITDEGLRAWSVRRVLGGSGGPEDETPGQECEQSTAPVSAPGAWYGVWAGRRTDSGITWAQQEVRAAREYASQGWAGWPDAPQDPARTDCDYLTELANRAPHPPNASGPQAALLGAALPARGGPPAGTGLDAKAEDAHLTAGSELKVTVEVTAPRRERLPGGKVSLALPDGWRAKGGGDFAALRPGERTTVEFTLIAPDDQRPRRVSVPVRLRTAAGHGHDELRFDVVPPIVAEQAPLAGVAEFQQWARDSGFSLLADSVPPVRTVPVGGRQRVEAVVRNYDDAPHTGTLRMRPPEGFRTADNEQPFRQLAPGETTTVGFDVTSTDPGMPTGQRGGDHHYRLSAHGTDGATGHTDPALELVPTTEVPRSQARQARQAPKVDGVATEGEYPGKQLDLSARWEGEGCESARDCAASARLTWHENSLHILVDVTDERLGSTLPPRDCKRHWRTDSVEIAIDPTGEAENTSSTLKLAVQPTTDDPDNGNPPCYARDADNHQGPGEETAPGARIASKLRDGGYTVEAAIPFDALPDNVDRHRMGLNLLVYDSDTDDKTAQTRLGWSAWQGVQGDPYRWGRAVLRDRPADEPREPREPTLPLDALSSHDSPASIAQAVRLGTALGAAPPATNATTVIDARASEGQVRTRLDSKGPGTAHVFVVNAAGEVLGDKVVRVDGPGQRWVPVGVRDGAPHRVLVGFANPDGALAASAHRIG